MKISDVVLSFCLLAPGLCLSAPTVAAPAQRRITIIVGNNVSENRSAARLRYADDDAVRYYQLFAPQSDRTILLSTLDDETQKFYPELKQIAREPSRDNLLRVLRRLKQQIPLADLPQTEILFIYGGHGNIDAKGMGYLELLRGNFSRDDLRELLIEAFPGARIHIILDSCKSYFMAFSRGKRVREDQTYALAVRNFLDREIHAQYPGVGFILSTSGDRDTHEWEQYRGGIFSHELVSGLLGPADLNLDGNIEYSEIAAFIAAANVRLAETHVELRVMVRPPPNDLNAKLVDLSRFLNVAIVHFPQAMSGHYLVEDARGIRVADFHKSPTLELNLVLLGMPPFYIRTKNRESIVRGDKTGWYFFDPKSEQPRQWAERGATETAFFERLFVVPFDWSFYQGYVVSASMPGVETEPRRRFGPPEHQQTRLPRLGLGYSVMNAPLDIERVMQGLTGDLSLPISRRFSVSFRPAYRYTRGRMADESFDLHMLELGALAVWSGVERGAVPRVGVGGGVATLVKSGSGEDGQDRFVPLLEGTVGFIFPHLLRGVDPGIWFGVRRISAQTVNDTRTTSHWVGGIELLW